MNRRAEVTEFFNRPRKPGTKQAPASSERLNHAYDEGYELGLTIGVNAGYDRGFSDASSDKRALFYLGFWVGVVYSPALVLLVLYFRKG